MAGSKNKDKSKSAPKPRNTVSRNPLMRKSHVHTTSKKAERAKAKKELNKELAQSDD